MQSLSLCTTLLTKLENYCTMIIVQYFSCDQSIMTILEAITPSFKHYQGTVAKRGKVLNPGLQFAAPHQALVNSYFGRFYAPI